MKICNSFVRFVLAAMMLAHPWSLARANLTFSTPTANTPYKVGATISYAGTANWAGGPNLQGITVELRYDTLSGQLIDSELAALSNYNTNNSTCNFSSQTPATITAGQDSGGHSTSYYLVATPYHNGGAYYVGGQIYKEWVALGAITP